MTRRTAGTARVKSIDLGQDWGVPLADIPELRRRQALAVGGGARRERYRNPHRSAARARQVGRGRRRTARPARSRPTACSGRAGAPKQLVKPGDVVYVEPIAGTRGRVSVAPDPGSVGRLRRDGSLHRPRAGDGRRLLLRSVRIQPRDAGAAPARLVVQALRLCDGARQRLYAVLDHPRRADRRSTRATAKSGRRRISKASPGDRIRCASASSIRSTR